jgi:PBSX family phage terminase large subunit
MIKDVCEEWETEELAKFITSPLSIRIIGGNRFAARGMDNPAKIRSFSNPSHAWAEEANQLTEDGFVTLITSLRSNKGGVKLYMSLNPEADTSDFNDFWLYKLFFKNYNYEKIYCGVMSTDYTVIEGGQLVPKTAIIKYRITFTTYLDNPYVSPQRIAFLENLKNTNPYWYQVFTNGRWGNQLNDNPWAFCYDEKKHVGYPEVNPGQFLYLSFDFNRNPAACLVIQWYNDRVNVLEAIKLPKSGTDAICEYILVKYPGFLYIVTGDYSGNTASSLYEEEVTNYSLIKHKLKLTDGQVKIKPNPRLVHNQTHVNNILFYYSVTIHKTKAAGLKFDMENVKKRADGTIVKDDRNNPAQQSDCLDCFRYFCNYFLDWFKPPQKR